MANFIYDNGSLPFPKSNLVAVPTGADLTRYVQATDWNAVCQAITDIKSVLRSSAWIGVMPGSDPAPLGVSAYLWVDGTTLKLKAAGNTYTMLSGSTTVTPGSYTNANLTIDAQGRITSATSGTSSVTIQDEGTPITDTPHATINFVGAGVSVSNASGVATVIIPGAPEGMSIQDEGSAVVTATAMNFTGAGVAVTNVGGVATVTITGDTTQIGNPISGATQGSVLFSGPSSNLAQDNANFFWDDGNNRLGIGTNAPSVALHVVGAARATTGLTVDSMTAGSIWFAGAAGALAQDNANLFWDDANNTLGVGTASPSASTKLDVSGTGRFVTASGTASVVVGSSSKQYHLHASTNDLRLAEYATTLGSASTDRVHFIAGGGAWFLTTTAVAAPFVGLSAWDNKYVRIAPTSGTTDSALAFGYNTASNEASILALAPNVAWRNMKFGANAYDWHVAAASTANMTLNATGLGLSVSPAYGIDVEKATGNTFGKFGSNKAVYLIASQASIGFNAYYNSGWKFGKGSSNESGGVLAFDHANGTFTFSNSNAFGSADQAITLATRMSLSGSGVLTLPALTATGVLFAGTNGVVTQDLTSGNSGGLRYDAANTRLSVGTHPLIVFAAIDVCKNSADMISLRNLAAYSASSGSTVYLAGDLTPTAAGHRLGRVTFGGWTGGGAVYREGAAVQAFAEATWSGGGTTHPTYLLLSTTTAGTTVASEKMRIPASGGFQMPDSSSSVSDASTGRLRYNAAAGHVFQVSLNGAAYVSLMTTSNISGSINTIAKFTDANTVGNSSVTDDGAGAVRVARVSEIVAFMVGDDTNQTGATDAGHKVFVNNDENIYFDTKVGNNCQMIWRTGHNTEAGTTRNWMLVTGSSGAVAFPNDVTLGSDTSDTVYVPGYGSFGATSPDSVSTLKVANGTRTYGGNFYHDSIGVTVDKAVLRANMGGTYDTTGGARTVYGIEAVSTATRSAGGNSLWNIGGYFDASGGQINQAIRTGSGDVILNANADATIQIYGAGQILNKQFNFFDNQTGRTASHRPAYFTLAGTYDTTAGPMTTYGIDITMTNTRSAGSNAFSNLGIIVGVSGAATENWGISSTATGGTGQTVAYYANASGAAGSNWSFYGAAGNIYNAGSLLIDGGATLGNATNDLHTLNGNVTAGLDGTYFAWDELQRTGFVKKSGNYTKLAYAAGGVSFSIARATTGSTISPAETFSDVLQFSDAGIVNATTGLTLGGVSVLTTNNVSGTTNYVPKFTGANTIGNSALIDDGTYMYTAHDGWFSYQVDGHVTIGWAPSNTTDGQNSFIFSTNGGDGNAYIETKANSGKGLLFTIGAGTEPAYTRTWMSVTGASGNVELPFNVQLGNSQGRQHTIYGYTSITTDSAAYALTVTQATAGRTISDMRTVHFTHGGSYDCTTNTPNSYALVGDNQATRSAGSNNLTNWGLYGTASGGQQNVGVGAFANQAGAINNYALYVQATGGTNNYSFMGIAGKLHNEGDAFFGGNVQIGNDIGDDHDINGRVIGLTSGFADGLNWHASGSAAAYSMTTISGLADGTFDATAVDRYVMGVNGTATATRSAGTNAVINIGVFATAANGQLNRAIQTNDGDVLLNVVSGETLLYRNFTVLGGATIGDGAGDAHALNGTLNANSTAGSNGEVLTIVTGVPKWAAASGGAPQLYGDGSFGDYTTAGDETWDATTGAPGKPTLVGGSLFPFAFFEDLTISAGNSVTVGTLGAGKAVVIFVRGTLTIGSGARIHANGGDASGATAGIGRTAVVGGSNGADGASGNFPFASGPGTSGGGGTDRPAKTSSARSTGGNGGAGGTGSANAGGSGGDDQAEASWPYSLSNALAIASLAKAIGGGNGGGSGGNGSSGTSGGGGGGGGTLIIFAKTIVAPAGSIQAKGGTGGNASSSENQPAGGGGGGSGGTILIVTENTTLTGVTDVSGGAGGAGSGSPAPGGSTGGVGEAIAFNPTLGAQIPV